MRKKGITAGGIALAIIFAVLAVVGVFVGVYWNNIKKIFDDVDEKYFEESEESFNVNEGFNLNGSDFNAGVFVKSVALAESDYEEYGVSEQAESAYSVSATYNVSYVSFPAVDWAVSFVNDASEWATGKTVTDYVTVSPISDGALEAVVMCLQPFGEQIQVSVTNREKPSVSASILCDYAKPITGFSVKINKAIGSKHIASGFVSLSDNWYDYSGLNLTNITVNNIGYEQFIFSASEYGLGTINGRYHVEDVSICYTGIDVEKFNIPELTLKDDVTFGKDAENGLGWMKRSIVNPSMRNDLFNLCLPLVDFYEEGEAITELWLFRQGAITDLSEGTADYIDAYNAYISMIAEFWDFENFHYFVSCKLGGSVEKEYLNFGFTSLERFFEVAPTDITTNVDNITFGE